MAIIRRLLDTNLPLFQASTEISETQRQVQLPPGDISKCELRVLDPTLSIIHLVPPEVWAQIFIYSYLDIFRISWVCGTWRRIVLSLPALWDMVSLDVNESETSTAAGQGIAYTWIKRSGDRFISVVLHHDRTVLSADITRVKAFLGALPDKERWRNVSLRPQMLALLFDNNEQGQGSSWGALEELAIYDVLEAEAQSTYARTPQFLGPVSLRHLTSLRRLTLSNLSAHFFTPTLLPYAQLTYLHLNITGELTEHLLILGHCTALENCIISHSRPLPGSFLGNLNAQSSQALFIRTIVLPRLRQLVLNGNGSQSLSLFLRKLTLPSLEALGIIERGQTRGRRAYPRPCYDLIGMLDRSECSLRTLEMHNSSTSNDGELVSLFERLVHLTVLRISAVGVQPILNDNIVRRLISKTSCVNTLLPRLTTLEVRCRWDQEILTRGSLKDFFNARTDLHTLPTFVVPLRNVMITNSEPHPLVISPLLAEMYTPFTGALEDYEL